MTNAPSVRRAYVHFLALSFVKRISDVGPGLYPAKVVPADVYQDLSAAEREFFSATLVAQGLRQNLDSSWNFRR